MTDMTATFEQELLNAARKLDRNQQRRVLVYARALNRRPKAITGEEAIRIAREINFDPAELALMKQALEEEFEIVSDSPEVNLDE